MMALTAAQMAAMSRLLDEVLPLDAAGRERWLANLPAEHADLAAALREALLRKPGEEPVAALLDTLPNLGDVRIDQPGSGETVGPYRLLRAIGQGGMGSVWLAERADASLKRRIALKLPRLAWGSGLAERMARERDIAALLEHPNIARLYDAGVDQIGRPYLALEYIDGQPIDAWCTEHQLTVPQRLRLFIQVVRAVAYAHGRLVVHRDLKPSNVLVSTDGQVHLLDFGIAKLLHEAGEASPEALTLQQGRVLTPHFASPEQIRGGAITVASDVYSLGVLLYQLLTAQLPYSGKTMGALERAILDDDLPPASSRVQEKVVARELRGDLDAILAKALKREAAERYATADALAQDLQRYLNGDPVQARPDSVVYRLRKAVRRHWVGVAASTAVVVAVVSGAGMAGVQAQRASRAAERERAVKEFVSEVFRATAQGVTSTELHTLPGDVFLARSAHLVRARFEGQPALQAEMYGVVGGIFADMGANWLASEYASRRLEALTAAGAGSKERTGALIDLATQTLYEGRLDVARRHAERAIELAGADEALQIEAKVVLARVLVARRNENEAAERVLDEIAATVARNGGKPAIADAWTKGLRAPLLDRANRRDQALALYDEAIAKAIAIDGHESPVATELRLDAARALSATQFADRASDYFEAAIASLRARGADHGIRAAFERARFATYRYIPVRQTTARAALEAVSRSLAEVASGGRTVPEELRARLETYQAKILGYWGDTESALPIADRSYPLVLRSDQFLAERSIDTADYGLLLMAVGQYEPADNLLREHFRLRQAMRQGAHPYIALDYVFIADSLSRQQRFREALDFLDTAPRFESMRGDGAPNPERFNLMIQLARSRTLLDSGEAREALAALPHELIAGAPHFEDDDDALALLGEAQCALGRRTDGVRSLRASLAAIAKHDEYEHDLWRARIRSIAGACVLQLGDRRQALAWAAQARAAFNAQPHASDYFRAPLLRLEASLRIRGTST
jgi:eukaryotic-like serine/threonine-protein kinase